MHRMDLRHRVVRIRLNSILVWITSNTPRYNLPPTRQTPTATCLPQLYPLQPRCEHHIRNRHRRAPRSTHQKHLTHSNNILDQTQTPTAFWRLVTLPVHPCPRLVAAKLRWPESQVISIPLALLFTLMLKISANLKLSNSLHSTRSDEHRWHLPQKKDRCRR